MAALLAHKGPSRQVQGGTSNKAATRSRTHEGRSISPRGSNPPIAQPNKQIVGNYQLQRKLGVGTFGEVRLAIHLPTGEKVAVKILEKSRVKEQADIKRVNREIKILKRARHGNVIQLYEVIDTPTAIYLMMENAEGGEMFDYIVAHRRLGEAEACKFFHQIVDGVEALHGFNITHRDLKPENLLLKAVPSGWVIKIADFGLSNTHEGGRFLSTACGSPCYAAPEMIAGKQYCGPLADIWSMGVILFALVCGYLPFEDPNTALLYKKILAGEYKSPRWISGQVRNLISKILVTEPSKRYTLSDIKRHVWYGAVDKADIPRDVSTDSDFRRCHEETVRLMQLQGPDLQTLLDGVASRVCNPTTATYHLLLQRRRTNRDVRLRAEGGEGGAVGLALRPHLLAGPTCKRDEKENERYDSTNRPEKFRGIVQGGVITRTSNNVREKDKDDEIIITVPKNYHAINRTALNHEAFFGKLDSIENEQPIAIAGSAFTGVFGFEDGTVKSTGKNDISKSIRDHNSSNSVNVIPSYLSLKVRNKIAAASAAAAVPVIAVAHVVRRPDQQPPSFAGRRAIRSPKSGASTKTEPSTSIGIAGLSTQPTKRTVDEEVRASDDSQEEPSGQKENSTRTATKISGPDRATRPKFMNRDYDPADGGRACAVTGAKIAYSVAGVFAAARQLTSHSRRPIVACIRRDKQDPHSASSPSPLTGEVSQEDREDVISADVDRGTAVDDAHAITDTLNKLDLNEIEMTITDDMTPIEGNLVTKITPNSLEVDRVLDIGAASSSAYDGVERCGTSIEIATAPNHNRSPISDKRSGVARGATGDRWEDRKGSDRDRRTGSDSEQLASQKAKALSLRQSGAGPLLGVTEREEEGEDHALSDSQSLSLPKLRQRESLQGSGSMTRPSDCSISAFASPRIAKAAVLEEAIPFRSRHGMATTSSSPSSSETDSVDLSNLAAAFDGSPTCLDRPNPATQPAALNKADRGPIGLKDTDVRDTSSVGQVDSRMKNRNVPVKPTPIRIGTTQAQSAYHGHRRLTQGNAFARPITLSSTQQAQDLLDRHTLLKTKIDDMLPFADRDSHSSTHGSSISRSEGNLAAQIQVVSDEDKLRSDSSPVRRLSPAKVPSAGHREGSAIQHAEHHAVQDDIHLEFLRGQKREAQPVTDRDDSETAMNNDRADSDSTQTRECEGAAAGPAVLVARPPAFPKSPSSPGTPRPPLTTKRTSLDSAYSQSRARRVVVPNGSTAS